MRLHLIAVGRMKAGPERELAERYAKRLAASARPLGMDWRGVTELAEARDTKAEARRDAEAAAILGKLDSGARVVALDERGEQPGSEAFAGLVGRFRDDGAPSLVLAIGGPDGHGAAIRERADALVAFGRLTWPHQIVRVMALEQLYRATTILAGHPYHRP